LKYVIDRFEGSLAVCEDEHGKMVNIDRNKLPNAAAEGDVLVPRLTRFVIDENETGKRKNNIQSLMKELWK
jgi:hypothetical protein